MMGRVKILAASLVGILVLIQFIQPTKTNPAIDPAREIGATLPPQPAVAAVLERSCNDCHSNHTVWPWYSNWAPVSWLVVHDVNDGRRKLNFAEWNGYTPDRQAKLLQRICKEASKGDMPVLPYSLMHPSARLTPSDVILLCTWTQSAQLPARSGGAAGANSEAEARRK